MKKPYYTPSFVSPEFRLSFAHLFSPDSFGNGTPKYSLVMVMPPEAMRVIRKQLKAAAEGMWGPDRAKWPVGLRKMDFAAHLSLAAKDGFPIRDGDDTTYEGYSGQQYCKASTTRAPGVVDIQRQPILDAEQIHAGTICRARLQAFAYERPDGAGVALTLEHVLLVKDDGTSWGGGSRVKAEDAFNEFMDDDGSEDAGNYAKTGTDDGADL